MWQRRDSGSAAGGALAALPRLGWAWLLVPGAVFLLVFLGLPLLEVVRQSLTPSPGETFSIFGSSPIYLQAFRTTFAISASTTVLCALVGYPFAYAMTLAGRRVTLLLTAIVLLPLWSSILVRSYAWTFWLQDTGIVNRALMGIGLTSEPVPLVRNGVGTTIGMTHVMLPYMVLAVYAGMQRIDRSLVTAAQTMGAPPLRAFREVFLPLSMKGVYSGCLIVFVMSLGFYVTPQLLGDPNRPMIGQQIAEHVQRDVTFGPASALGVTVLAVTLVILLVASKVFKVNGLQQMRAE